MGMNLKALNDVLSQIQVEPAELSELPNDRLGYLKAYAHEKDKDVPRTFLEFLKFLETPVDAPQVWGILAEMYGQRSFTMSDVYEAIKILETNQNDPYMSYKIVEGKAILYMPKEKWERWVMDVYERLPEKDKDEVMKIAKEMDPYKIYKAMKFLNEKNRGR